MTSNNAQAPNVRTDLIAFFSDVLPPPATGQVFVAGTLPKPTGTGRKPPMHHAYSTTHAHLADEILKPGNVAKENYFALARFRPHKTPKGYPGRQGEYAESVNSFWLDLDCGEDKAAEGDGYLTQENALSELADFIRACGLPQPTYVVNSGGGVHVYWCLAQEIPAAAWKSVAARLKTLTEHHGLRADPSRTADIASVLRPPGTNNHKLANPRPVAIIFRGDPVTLDDFSAAVEATFARLPVDQSPTYGLPVVATVLPVGFESNIPPSSFGPPDMAKLKSAMAALDPNTAEKDWKFYVAALAREARKYPALHDELKDLARSWSRGDLHGILASKWCGDSEFDELWQRFITEPLYPGKPITIGSIFHAAKTAGGGQPEEVTPTDTDNARRFVQSIEGRLCYVHGLNIWLRWSPKACRWIFCNRREQIEVAKACARLMLEDAAKESDDDKRKRRVSHALKTLDIARLTAMVKLSESDPRVGITSGKLDTDPWLLGVKNGVVNLRTGVLRDASPNDFITKQAGTIFDNMATCLLFEQTLRTIFNNDRSLIDFFQRVCGYALFGEVREHMFFFCHGFGANGKSTLLNVVQAAMGDYAITLPTESLMMSKRDSSAPTPDLMMLRGVRLALASETEDGQRLAEARIKQLTGGDLVTARALYGSPVTFPQTAKLVIVGNHKPQITGTDDGIWRRVQLVPFEVTIPTAQRDHALPGKLLGELPGILAWMVRGCLMWQQSGLNPPPAVTLATNAYKAESDILGEWIADCCTVSPAGTATSGDLFSAYRNWALRNGYHPWYRNRWGRLMGDKFSKGRNGAGQTIYTGVDLTPVARSQFLHP
jgi:putative DNA primase/helicase